MTEEKIEEYVKKYYDENPGSFYVRNIDGSIGCLNFVETVTINKTHLDYLIKNQR